MYTSAMPRPRLFRPQRDLGIHATRLTGGERDGQQRDEAQQSGGGDQDDGVPCGHLEEETGDQPRGAHGSGQANRDAACRQTQAVPDDEGPAQEAALTASAQKRNCRVSFTTKARFSRIGKPRFSQVSR